MVHAGAGATASATATSQVEDPRKNGLIAGNARVLVQTLAKVDSTTNAQAAASAIADAFTQGEPNLYTYAHRDWGETKRQTCDLGSIGVNIYGWSDELTNVSICLAFGN